MNWNSFRIAEGAPGPALHVDLGGSAERLPQRLSDKPIVVSNVAESESNPPRRMALLRRFARS